MSTIIVVDSASDIPREDAKKMGMTLLPMHVYFGNEEYLEGVTLSNDQFYEKLVETDTFPKTSQIPPAEYEDAFKKILDESSENEIVCITVSAGLSGCYQSACMAATEFPGRVFVVDSMTVSLAEKIIAEFGQKLADEGKTAREVAEILEIKKNDAQIIALLDTLEYLKKGGRISSAVALAGNLLSIKPVVTTENGEVVLLGQARGSKAGNNKLNEFVKKTGGIDFTMPICLGYTGLDDKLLSKYANDSKELYAEYDKPLGRYRIGCAVGTHVGPGAIATAFFSKSDSDK
ncbi:MAG: DegV family protein [Lachnospiraceae bacterium]|nr:DegV family protein [Lachnospiraceae bacterium]